MEKIADCDVKVPADLRTGVYANSFRVVRDGDDVFLDFVSYSPREHVACVVARVRCRPKLLGVVQERVGRFMAIANGFF